MLMTLALLIVLVLTATFFPERLAFAVAHNLLPQNSMPHATLAGATNAVDWPVISALLFAFLVLYNVAQWWNARVDQRNKTAKRALPVVYLNPARCEKCIHWNLNEGQAVMQKFPAFAGAASAITPAEMAYGYEIDPETDKRTKLRGPKEAATLAWNEFGACQEHHELRHKRDTCDSFMANGDA